MQITAWPVMRSKIDLSVMFKLVSLDTDLEIDDIIMSLAISPEQLAVQGITKTTKHSEGFLNENLNQNKS